MCRVCFRKDQEIALLLAENYELREVLQWILEEDKDWRARDMIRSVLGAI